MKKFEYREEFSLSVADLNALGADGWEAVTVERGEEYWHGLFKREIPLTTSVEGTAGEFDAFADRLVQRINDRVDYKPVVHPC